MRNLRIRNPADRDDAIQGACAKCLSRGKTVSPALLKKTIENCHKDQVKADRRRKRREKSRATAGRSTDLADFDEQSPLGRTRLQQDERSVDNPSARLERRETRQAIKRAVRAAGLKTDHRCALWAWSRGRVAEFARKRGVAEATVRVWVHRAIQDVRPYMLRECLGRD